MAETIKKYSIMRFKDGRLLLKTMEDDNIRAMTTPEIRELIQDLLNCWKAKPFIIGTKKNR